MLLRLEILADDLLVLNRSQSGADQTRLRPVDLDELVLSQAEQLRASTALTVDVSAVSGAQVLASEVDMIRIIENLSSNARRHATGRIRFGVTEAPGSVRLLVEDDGQAYLKRCAAPSSNVSPAWMRAAASPLEDLAWAWRLWPSWHGHTGEVSPWRRPNLEELASSSTCRPAVLTATPRLSPARRERPTPRLKRPLTPANWCH